MAYANHVLGVSLESHTKNMVFDIDTTTGKIKEIYFQNFSDTLLNPMPLLADGKLPESINWERVRSLSIHGNYFVNQSAAVAKDIWHHASLFANQGITNHVLDFQKQQRHLHTFLQLYILEVEKIIGQPLILSKEAKRTLNYLELKVSKGESYRTELQKHAPLRDPMITVLKPIFEQIHKIKVEKINQDLQAATLTGDQKRISKAFYKLLLAQRVIYMSDDAKLSLAGQDTKYAWLKNILNTYLKLGLTTKKIDSSIVFKIHEGRLWAMDSSSDQVLAVTVESFNLKPTLIESLAAKTQDFLKTQTVIQCKSLF